MEGVRYIQVGLGLCPGACHYLLEMLVSGPEAVSVATAGHYVLMRDTAPLQRLTAGLPEWSVGAEWTKFVSKLIATKV